MKKSKVKSQKSKVWGTAVLTIFSVFILTALLIQPAMAQEVTAGLEEVGGVVKLSATDPRVIASRIINVALGLLGIVMVSIIIYGGFLYMTSGGDEAKVEKAKKTIRNAVIGLILILSSWGIATFIIQSLLRATQEGGPGAGAGAGGPPAGGFFGAGVSNVFQVKGISPQGSVPIRNVQVKLLFTRPVDEKSISAIVITKDGGASVGGTISVQGASVTFTPADACPDPNQNLKCFEGETNYTIQIGGGLRSTTGQTIVCGGFAPACTGKFKTGNLIDTQPPTVAISEPLEGQAVPADSLVTIRATATDDSGVAYIDFFDEGKLIDQAAPTASTTPTTFNGEVQWDTAGILLQSVRSLTATSYDINDHKTTGGAVSVVIRSPSCFNGVQDGDETDIDCGGTPNTPGYCGACSGGACTSNSQCSSSVCQNGACVDQPTITNVSPLDGRPGTFVTLKGFNFGNSGKVVFLGGTDANDDREAQVPPSCKEAGFNTWSETQVIVAVPDGASSGPLQLTNVVSALSDATNDTRGPKFADFVVNDAVYPGICGLEPAQGFVGDQFKVKGTGFGDKPSSVSFGSSNLTSFSAWADDQIVANVPVVGIGKHAVKVKVGEIVSNSADFNVLNKATAGPPKILSITPAEGPRGEYITVNGLNFGYSVGTVRFKNKINDQEAIGDTAFPAACAEGFWSETGIIVKVPQLFTNQTQLSPGDYSVRVVRSDNSESNALDFVVTTGNAKPGICSIVPTVGPVGTDVTLTGERFGGDTGNMTFYENKSAFVASWTNGEIKSSVPAGAVTGPVTVTAGGIKSNPINFQVRNCNEQPGVCSQNEQCCPNGSCIPASQTCGVVSQKAMFAWQSSTGLIPVSPRVVEECEPTLLPPPVPSPSPWNRRAGGDNVCVNATIAVRFTTHLEPTTVTADNFSLKKCTSQATEPCTTTEEVSLGGGFPMLQPASVDQDMVRLQGQADLEPNTTYLVEITTGVKGLGVAGANMEENTACGPGIAYCFRFKTRASTEPCKLGAVSVVPHPFELNDSGQEVNYQASPVALDDKCVVLQCEKFNWDWEHGDGNSDGRAIFATPLNTVKGTGNISCLQTGIAVTETGNVPVNMNAIAKPDNVKGTAHLFVRFVPPRVDAYAPNCNQACVNALIWARFSTEIDPNSIAGNVEVRQCANENCILTELSSPLPIPTDAIKVTTLPKSTETKKRFLRIEAAKPGALPGTKDMLLLPNKYYRVLLKGGTDKGIRGLNGVPMTGLNDPEGFVWTFRTKLGTDAFCTAESVDVAPLEKYETSIGDRELFVATAFGKPDECSVIGQALVQTASAAWATSNKKVADFVGTGSVDTGGSLPARCSAECLAMGAEAVFGKVAVCGNGIIETTDPEYCNNNKTTFGDGCSLLSQGAKAGEQCDPGILSNVGLCDPNTCLWKPIGQVPSGTCGNGKIDFGEACDFATSTQYRGCSPFCRHTGSKSGNSTCGNGDIADGEDCDDGNLNSNDGCSSDCLHTGSSATVASVCGNAILEPGETCEKANVNDTTFPSGCDPQYCVHAGTSLCDNDPNTTDANCCGNSTVEAGEDCDDGNKLPGDGCSPVCLLDGSSSGYIEPSFCSDGILGTGEQCEVDLPSSDKALQTAPNNAAPTPPQGAPKGDGIVDNVQLAYVVGDADPDEKGLMSSKISAELEGKKGEATYGLQCGFTDEKACKSGYGLTDQGCCNVRPKLANSYPSGTGVCRNVQISVTFNVPMEFSSAVGNVQIAKEVMTSCPTGTEQVADDFTPVKPGLKNWFKQTWKRIVAWWTGNPAMAAVWCAGSINGSWVPATATGTQSFTFYLVNALEADTKYRVKFFGDNSTTTDSLADNADASKKVGIKTVKGVVAEFDSSLDSGPLTFSFTTGKDICTVSLVQVTDTSKEHPLLFLKDAEQHPFKAEAVSLQKGGAVPIVPVSEYSWQWLPWTTSKDEVVYAVNPLPNQPMATMEARNKNGTALAVAWLKITNDSVSSEPTTDKTVQGTAPVTVNLCENPWPNKDLAPFAPFRDKKPTGNGDDSTLTGSIFEKGPYFNFSTTYCRDAGNPGTKDDLPKLVINHVPPTTTDKVEGILRQYLFTYGDEHKALKKDGIGIRIAANPLHYSPEDWYRWRGFGGRPEPIVIDGYRALKDGTTTYIAGANTDGPGKAIYSNIYLISRNPDASPVTVGIYEQMVRNLAFNINITNGVANVCEEGNDPNVEPSPPYIGPDGRTVKCSTDFDCLKLGDDYHCGSYQLKLARDTARVADFQAMSKRLDEVYSRDNVYPKLTGGTFLQSFTNSRWPSWDLEFAGAVASPQPKDPVNVFLTCGRCSQSKAPCGANSDCPAGQTCNGVTFEKGEFLPATSTEALTCWDVEKRKYLCPKIGASPSRIYQYRAVNAGRRYELASEFEVPEPNDPKAEWWSPPLTKEIKRCANKETFGFLCDVDADCRQCPNPKDMSGCPVNKYPITNGACRAVGGRFVYQNICNNTFFGQSGTCGDGVIGTACLGGANNGNPCLKDADCPGGGSCVASEVCEIGQTKFSDCTTSENKPGLKLQLCNECKEFLDDVNLSQCNASELCGNGRVDKLCKGGLRNSLGCLSDTDCKGDVNTPDGACLLGKETCDDGVLNGTYGHCNVTCNGYAAYCGDGLISPGELCDNGQQNGAYCDEMCNVNLTCSLDCKSKAPHCGDGIITAPEQCDGQTQTTILGICTQGTGKDKPCKTDAECGEMGKCASGVDPLASCEGKTLKKCATAMKQCVTPTYTTTNHNPANFKVCKDDAGCAGESGGKTSCRAVQEFVSSCTANNQCSLGAISGECLSFPTAHIRTCNAPGVNQCKFSTWSECKVIGFCGDGVIDKPAEECDDGGSNGDTKACTSTCKKNICGDGKPFVGVEECDAGAQNGQITCSADYSSTCASCSTMCRFLTTAGGYCGDAQKNGPEQCDGMDDVKVTTDQIPNCKNLSKYSSFKEVCDLLNADCTKTPCMKTKESGVTCKSLGYDFAINGVKPELFGLNEDANKPATQSVCFSGMKKYEMNALKACLGIKCVVCINYCPPFESQLDIVSKLKEKYAYMAAPSPGQEVQAATASYLLPQPLPSANEFWKCIKEKGPALGVGIKTADTPELVSCTASCGFGGCAKCSDEAGTGVVKGQVVDAVYNQVVPQARVSLYYKGVLVKQVPTNDNGHFEVTGLNDRPECSQYKLVIDKYDDNPCTGNVNRPKDGCDKNKTPDWTYSYQVDEGALGGYWPLTTPIFSVKNFIDQVSTQKDGRIFLFPRPGVGEAYFTVLWGFDWSDQGSIWGGYNNHLILPKTAAYTAPIIDEFEDANYPQSFSPTTCNYDTRPAFLHQCVRDITWTDELKGHPDLTKLPYAQLICLHKAGDKVQGFGWPWDIYNGCPVEGRSKCLAANPQDYGKCSKGQQWSSCTVCNKIEKKCVGGWKAGLSCTGDFNCPGGGTCVANPVPCEFCTKEKETEDCGVGGVCAPEPCQKEWWNTCYFYKDGPLTTYFRYGAFIGSQEPLRMYWGTWEKSIHVLQNNPNWLKLKDFLKNLKYRAVISTDKQIFEINAKDVANCGVPEACKFWHLADLNPIDGTLTIRNALREGRGYKICSASKLSCVTNSDCPKGESCLFQVSEGMAKYQYDFQGINDQEKHCIYDNVLIKRGCSMDIECLGFFTPTAKCITPTKQQWSRANY